MRCIIAGGRDFTNYIFMKECIDDLVEWGLVIEEIVCGLAKGADSLGWHYANNHSILVKEFPAEWDKYGKAAGYRRNVEMAKYSDMLIAFWDGESKGTNHMIATAKKYGLDYVVFNY
jgi:hypothetical protein